MRVAIYARYSTDSQDRTSIAGQIANAEALASREGLEVVARFQDEGRSGNDDKRAGYGALLAALKRGEFVGIVCDETSRITRNQAELHRLVAELRFRDQFLLTVDGIDTRSEASEIILSVKAAIDQMEGRKIGTRTYRSLRERHKDGHCAGGRVYGYRIVPDGDYKRRVIEPEQAAIVKEIFERYAAGEGPKAIARDLNARRIPSPGAAWNMKKRRAAGWPHTTIIGAFTKASGILRNPIYAGRSTWNKRRGKKVPGTAQRIQKRRPDAEWIEHRDESLRVVSDELWSRVQKRIGQVRERHSRNRGGRPARYLLSGLLVCRACGGHYVLRNGRDYSCSSHTNGRNSLCTQRRVLRRDRAEIELLEGVKKTLSAPGVLAELSKRMHAKLRQRKQPDRTTATEELQRVNAQIENVVDSLTAIGRSAALTDRLAVLERRKHELKVELNRKPTELLAVPDATKRFREMIEKLQDLPRLRNVDDAMMYRARASLHDYIGPVDVAEEGDGIFAYVEMGRAVLLHGAQERT